MQGFQSFSEGKVCSKAFVNISSDVRLLFKTSKLVETLIWWSIPEDEMILSHTILCKGSVVSLIENHLSCVSLSLLQTMEPQTP